MKKRNNYGKIGKAKGKTFRTHKELGNATGGVPNTFIDVRDIRSGRILRRKKLNEKGKQKLDMDFFYNDSNRIEKKDHVHIYLNEQRVKEHLEPNKKQIKEMKKAKKKRRFWK